MLDLCVCTEPHYHWKRNSASNGFSLLALIGSRLQTSYLRCYYVYGQGMMLLWQSFISHRRIGVAIDCSSLNAQLKKKKAKKIKKTTLLLPLDISAVCWHKASPEALDDDEVEHGWVGKAVRWLLFLSQDFLRIHKQGRLLQEKCIPEHAGLNSPTLSLYPKKHPLLREIQQAGCRL